MEAQTLLKASIAAAIAYILLIIHRKYLELQVGKIIGKGRLLYALENKYPLIQAIPYLNFMFNEYGPIIGTASAIAIAYVAIYAVKHLLSSKQKPIKLSSLIIKTWLLVLFTMPFIMPHSTENARIIFESTIPLSIVLAEIIAHAHRKINAKAGQKYWQNRALPYAITTLIIIILAVSSQLGQQLILVTSNSQKVREIQFSAYDAITWLSKQPSCSVASIVLPHFKYLEVFTDCRFLGDYYANATAITQLKNITYVAVAKYYRHIDTYK